jgi:hypothetical protein
MPLRPFDLGEFPEWSSVDNTCRVSLNRVLPRQRANELSSPTTFANNDIAPNKLVDLDAQLRRKSQLVVRSSVGSDSLEGSGRGLSDVAFGIVVVVGACSSSRESGAIGICASIVDVFFRATGTW